MHEHYQSGYPQSQKGLSFLFLTILCMVQTLHSYEYEEGKVPLFLRVK